MTDPLENAGRIERIQSETWVGYPRAIEIRDRLEELLHHPVVHRMPNLAIIGATNNGKTMLLHRFCKNHEPDMDPNKERTELPVLMIQSPPKPDEARLYNAFLKPLFAEGSVREAAEAKLGRLQVILREMRTRLLIIDEFNYAIAGTPLQQRSILNAIKYLSNELKISIVVAGTPEALNAIQADDQTANRFEPEFLPKWTYDKEYRRLLASLEAALALKVPSKLSDEPMARRLLDVSEGLIGEMTKVIKKVAIQAINDGTECITLDSLSDDNLKTIRYRRPSERQRYPG